MPKTKAVTVLASTYENDTSLKMLVEKGIIAKAEVKGMVAIGRYSTNKRTLAKFAKGKTCCGSKD